MNKSELIKELKIKMNMEPQEARTAVDTFFDSISDALSTGERVEIRDFCSFFVKKYKGYTGRNPKTGETARVSSKKLPFFKCGKDLKERINEK